MRVFGLVMVGLVSTVTLALGQAGKDVNAGVYTAAQATRGAAVFDEKCTACHDSARFTGPDFVKGFSGKPLHDLWDAVNTMPEDNPGSLTPQQYADVISYFLKLNEYPEGKEELAGTPEAMKAITMQPRKP